MRISETVLLKIKHTFGIARALRLVWQSGPSWTIVSVVLFMLQGTLPLLSLYLMKLVVDAVTIGMVAPNKEASFRHIAFLVGIAGTVSLVGASCRSVSGLVNEAQAQLVTNHMHNIIHSKSIDVSLEYYESSQYYDKLHRAQEEAPFRPTRIVNNLVQVVQSGISLLAITGLLSSLHWVVAASLFVAAIPGVFVRFRYADKLHRWQHKRTLAERQSWYFSWILTGDIHAKEIRLFNSSSLFMRRFRDLRQQLFRERLKITSRRSVMELVTQLSATLAIFGSYLFISYQTIKGITTLGDLVMYYQAFQRGQDFLQGLLGSFAGLYEDNLFLSNLYEFIDMKPKVAEPLHPKPVPKPMKTGLVFDHVSFQYPMSNRKVLEDITLTIKPAELVALVGENGSGKTTLIKLLCRLYDPTEGKITLDTIDLRQFETTALRGEISVIFQDYAKYYLTARENIWVGNIELPPDHKKILEAAHQADANDVITKLPRGYETILSNWFEDGQELSIGQWQKVALARVFLREGQIIVLDEPTSALDAKAEEEVLKNFRQLVKGRAAILISHRLSTVKMADCIYVLEHGRIVESGTHDELIQHGGTYARLFETQAQHYR